MQKKRTISTTPSAFMELIDTHCHLDISQFSSRFSVLLQNAQQVGVKKIVLPGVDQEGWQRMFSLCRENKGLYAAPGLHPLYLAHHRAGHLEELKTLVNEEEIVAIGEIGLDYHVPELDKNAQQSLFEEQLKLAMAADLPILLHVRKAHDQTLSTLRKKRFCNGGIVHAYNGSLQQAKQFIELGFVISLCGTITYDRAQKIRRVASELPAQAIVLETDAPDIPLAGHRGEDNLPEHLPEILATLATLRGEKIEEVARYTTANAKRVLKISD